MKIPIGSESLTIPDALIPSSELMRLFSARLQGGDAPSLGPVAQTPAIPAKRPVGRPRGVPMKFDYGTFTPQILAFIQAHPGCSHPQICDALPQFSRRQVSTGIQSLRKTGQIKNTGGRRHAARYEAVIR